MSRRAAWIVVCSVAGCADPGAGDRAMGDGLAGTRDAPYDGASSSIEQAATVCADGSTVKGIDVSYYQGSIDWSDVRSDGVRYAFIRASHGTGFVDPKFPTYWQGAKSAGVLRGAYQYFEPDQSATAQADLLVEKIFAGGKTDLPPVIDVESTGGQSAATIKARVGTWMDRVQARLGYKAIIYTGKYFWQDHVGNTSAYDDHALWHPQYTSASCPDIAGAWSDWQHWQFTSTGDVDGIAGDVDINRFNGTLAQLTPNHVPRGALDGTTCARIKGWAQDVDAPNAHLDVKVFFDGVPATGVVRVKTSANVSRNHLCSWIGSCEHGFTIDTPLRFKDNAEHTVRAYAIDRQTGALKKLAGTTTFDCAPPTRPLGAAAGVFRHVPGADAMSAWGLSFNDVAPYTEAQLASYERAAAWPETPRLVRKETGTVVFVVDGDVRRAVPGVDAMHAWGFANADVEVLPGSEVTAIPLGTPLPEAPFLLRVSGASTVWLLDAKPTESDASTAAPVSAPDELDMDEPMGLAEDVPVIEEEDDDARFVAGSEEPDEAGEDDEGGCAQTPASDVGLVACAALTTLAARRARRGNRRARPSLAGG